MIKHMEYHKNESGRSMIEMIGVLALMGLITAVAFTLIRSTLTSQKVSRTADDINTLAANVRAIFAGSSDFSKLPSRTTNPSNDAKKIAGAILNPNTTTNNATAPIGGTYSVSKDSDTSKFWVEISGMNFDDCHMMAARSYAESDLGEDNDGVICGNNGNKLSIRYKK